MLQRLLRALLVAVVWALFVRTFLLQGVRVPSASMRPALEVGDLVLVNKFGLAPAATDLERWLLPLRPVRRGDVVLFKYPPEPSRDFLKRCVAVAGDTVEIHHGRLLLDGWPSDERGYVAWAPSAEGSSAPWTVAPWTIAPWTIAGEQLFMLGDNRGDSNDSRSWGTVPKSYIKGRALLVYGSAAPGRRWRLVR